MKYFPTLKAQQYELINNVPKIIKDKLDTSQRIIELSIKCYLNCTAPQFYDMINKEGVSYEY